MGKGRILSIIVFVILIIGAIIFLFTQNIGLLFKKTVKVSNIIELEKCKEGDYVEVEFETAYPTDFKYEKDGQTLAKFVDIDVNGKALIGIVSNKLADKIEKRKFWQAYSMWRT